MRRRTDARFQRHSLLTAKKYLRSICSCPDDSARTSRFRSLVHESRTCNRARSLVLNVYKLLGNGDFPPGSLDDKSLFLTAPAENLELIPFIRCDVERMLHFDGHSEDSF